VRFLMASVAHSPKTDSAQETSIMAKVTQEWLSLKAKEVCEPFEDGFQWTDLFAVLPEVSKVAEMVSDLTDEEKKDTAIELINYIIDEWDTPWVPDSIVDPILKKATPYLVDLAIEKVKKKE